ncbi:hypothetical protein ACIRTB_12110 [Streptomyces sp. NPDC101158]|uniref:hypothetical protein n=1 Tax=Streptomyces sp. NPDC101158 TaxID=3366117 RepID=UPI003828E3BB
MIDGILHRGEDGYVPADVGDDDDGASVCAVRTAKAEPETASRYYLSLPATAQRILREAAARASRRQRGRSREARRRIAARPILRPRW